MLSIEDIKLGPQGVRWARFLSVISCHTCKNSICSGEKKLRKRGKSTLSVIIKMNSSNGKKNSPRTQLSNITNSRYCVVTEKDSVVFQVLLRYQNLQSRVFEEFHSVGKHSLRDRFQALKENWS